MKPKHYPHLLNGFFLFSLFCILTSCQQTSKTVEPPIEEIAAIESSLLPTFQFEGEELVKFSIEDRLRHYNVPGVSIAVIKDGKLHWAKAYGVNNTETNQPVDINTVFQAGSISKPVAALAALKLADQGKIDLDEDVNTYLKDWKVPENRFTEMEKVTLRRLVTHNAGMTVHGFPGYTFQDTIPSVVAVLDGQGNTAKIRVDTTPGAIYRYSGGGYTVMQKMVEDITGQDYAAFLQKEVLEPLGMKHSTYFQPLPEKFHSNASAAFNSSGVMAEGLWNNYPEKAAAGLWTTPSDLALYCLDVQQTLAGKPGKVLSEEMTKEMLKKHMNNRGLGPSLQYSGDSLTFGHGGKNRGFSNTMTAFAYKGDGLIIMTSADRGRALYNEIKAGISEYYGWGWYKPQKITRAPLSEEDLEAFEGSYFFKGSEITAKVTQIGDKLDIYLYEPDWRRNIYPTSDSTFIDLVDGSEFVFRKNEAGEITGYLSRGRFFFEKVKDEIE